MRRFEGEGQSSLVRLAFTSRQPFFEMAAQPMPNICCILAPLLRLPIDQLGQRLHIRHSNREQIVHETQASGLIRIVAPSRPAIGHDRPCDGFKTALARRGSAVP